MLFIVPVLYFFVPQALASCPPLQSETVRVVCWLGERAVDCMKDPVPPGTLARFFCMPGHQLSLPNMPPARFQSRCGSDSAWSMQPFSCQPVTCPPLQLRTVVADCTLAGQPVPCKEQPVSPGTVATFKCKPGHKIKFGYSRDPNFQSQCGTDGLWSEGPFRCEPESSASAATPAPVTCPPLESKTVLAECRFQGRPFDCTARSVPAGTTARFRCKPLHQFLFGYLPASSFESQCGADGQWTVQPFRCEPICGQPTGKGISFIRDGNVTASAADFPWHVVIYDLTKDLQQICGGTLISPKYFVSAAHCFHDGKKMSPEAIYRAGFGKIKRNVSEQEPNEQYRELEKIYIKDYGGSKELYSNDISLVELRDEVDITSTTMPVCVDWGLELPNLRHGELGAVVGFGDTAERAHDSLRFALLPFIKSAECKRHVTDSLAVYNKLPDKFCIGFVNRTTVAKGDSGGGIAFPNEERAWYLRGVVSLGSSQETTYSFFTNLTTFVPWMSGLIQLGEVSGRRCGVDVNQASIVSGAAAGQFDFPWEVDVYYKQTSNHDFERLTTGALIGPNLIITRAKSVTSTGQPIDLSEYPSTWLRVTPRREAHFKSLEKAINVSEVVRGFFPSDVLAASGLFYNILLLELKQPVHLMPVCLDWTGGALLKKERLGTALSDYETDNSTLWTRLPILNTTSCKQLSSAQPGSHHVCTVQEGPKQLRAHNSLYVFAGSTWFLRGVGSDSVSTPDGTVTAYTDMSDRGVRQWLSKTSDMIGKPTCGNVNLCEPLSAGLSLRGHMPWTVAVVVGSGSGSRTESGMLIQPNAVLTDSAAVVNLSGWNGDGIVPTVSTDSIAVFWTAADGSVKRSQVVRVLVREGAEVGKDGRPLLDVALLELRPDQAVLATPICLDLNGNVLQPLATGQLGLVEAWSSWGPTNHSLVSVPFMGPAECSTQLRQSSNRSRESNEFCTSATPGVLDPTAVLGGGFLVSSGSQWYLQGLYTGFARLRHRTVGLASDFRDDALKGWMREELRKIKPVNLKSPDDSGPKNCVGGRPTATECGLFNSKDELQDENDFLYKASRNRMEWNVQVHVYRNNPVWEVRGGVLIRTSMVVTSALNMFSRKSNESSGPGEAIRTSNVLVKYITADGRGPFSVEVEVWDDAYSSQRTLVPTLFRTLGACRIAPPVDFLNAEFCTEPTSVSRLRQSSSSGLKAYRYQLESSNRPT
ncbi:uncharacterized protein LOC117649629 [Thrips palmi]|uniref:Uncharacterized protein LOC117649629 n=1 Tax=Thrips palmi TaxID=161013 RepID=A0A6P8ZTL6_THRPL|nr:uncharacterized protein LOC117649629 [Thrips palmi]